MSCSSSTALVAGLLEAMKFLLGPLSTQDTSSPNDRSIPSSPLRTPISQTQDQRKDATTMPDQPDADESLRRMTAAEFASPWATRLRWLDRLMDSIHDLGREVKIFRDTCRLVLHQRFMRLNIMSRFIIVVRDERNNASTDHISHCHEMPEAT